MQNKYLMRRRKSFDRKEFKKLLDEIITENETNTNLSQISHRSGQRDK